MLADTAMLLSCLPLVWVWFAHLASSLRLFGLLDSSNPLDIWTREDKKERYLGNLT